MGWASGSTIFSSVISSLKSHVAEEPRKKIYRELIIAFQAADWDTLDECIGEDPAYDAALGELYPSYFEEEEDAT